MIAPLRGDCVGLPARPRAGGPDPTFGLEARDGAIERTGAQPDAGESLDILHHRVAVFIAFSQAGENEQCRVGHDYYAIRSNVTRTNERRKGIFMSPDTMAAMGTYRLEAPAGE